MLSYIITSNTPQFMIKSLKRKITHQYNLRLKTRDKKMGTEIASKTKVEAKPHLRQAGTKLQLVQSDC